MGFYINDIIKVELTHKEVCNLTLICTLYIKYRDENTEKDPDDVVYVDLTKVLQKLQTNDSSIELTWQEICTITMSYNYYINNNVVDDNTKKDLQKILNKIERLLTDHADNNIPNGH